MTLVLYSGGPERFWKHFECEIFYLITPATKIPGYAMMMAWAFSQNFAFGPKNLKIANFICFLRRRKFSLALSGWPWSPVQKLHKIEAQVIHTSLGLVQKVCTRFGEFKISHCWRHLVVTNWWPRPTQIEPSWISVIDKMAQFQLPDFHACGTKIFIIAKM